MKYIKCPKCELNYIDADKQEMCDVYLSEVATKIKPTKHGTTTVKQSSKSRYGTRGGQYSSCFRIKSFKTKLLLAL